MPRARYLIPSILAVTLLAFALNIYSNHWSWHEKITVHVETPDGEKSASSVIRETLVHTDGWFTLPEARGASSSISGEAVVLEVAPGKYLFALLKDLPSPFKVFFPGEAPVEVASRMERLRASRTLPSDLYPLLVTFTDINDPASVRRVDPADLDATFGCGKNAVRSVDTPWRTAGKTHAQWIKDETWRLANKRAAARAGITGRAATALEEYFRISRPNAAEKQRLRELSFNFTREQLRRWYAARESLLETIPDTLPSVEAVVAARGGSTCYRIKSITLKITKENKTLGRIESVLPLDFFKQSTEIKKNALRDGSIRHPYFRALSSQLTRDDFIR